jgi:hypothetical protein
MKTGNIYFDARWWCIADTGGACDHIHRSYDAAERCLARCVAKHPEKHWRVVPANTEAEELAVSTFHV